MKLLREQDVEDPEDIVPLVRKPRGPAKGKYAAFASARRERTAKQEGNWTSVVNSSEKQKYAVFAGLCAVIIALALFAVPAAMSALSSGSHSEGAYHPLRGVLHANANSTTINSTSSSDSSDASSDASYESDGEDDATDSDSDSDSTETEDVDDDESNEDWDRLLTTWGTDPTEDYIFVPPRLEVAEVLDDWQLFSKCDDNDADQRLGIMYKNKEDKFSALPYYSLSSGDLLGVVIGVSDPGNSSRKAPFYQFSANGTQFWGVQFAFRHPAHVCNDDEVSGAKEQAQSYKEEVESYASSYYGETQEEVEAVVGEKVVAALYDAASDGVSGDAVEKAAEDLADDSEVQDIIDAAETAYSMAQSYASGASEQAVSYVSGKINSFDGTYEIGDRFLIRSSEDDNTLDAFDEIPLDESDDELSADGWSKGSCFAAMGAHYFKDITEDTSCSDAYPVFLQFANKRLLAFGVSPFAEDFPYQSTRRWEHFTASKFSKLMAESPSCVSERSSELSTMHVYLADPVSVFQCE
jgi:hypothetical protein